MTSVSCQIVELGTGPYSFSPSLLGKHKNTNPTIGTKIHQPLRPISCILRMATAMLGTKVTNVKRRFIKAGNQSPMKWPTNPDVNPINSEKIMQNKKNIQYSVRLALPLKSPNLFITEINQFIEPPNLYIS